MVQQVEAAQNEIAILEQRIQDLQPELNAGGYDPVADEAITLLNRQIERKSAELTDQNNTKRRLLSSQQDTVNRFGDRVREMLNELESMHRGGRFRGGMPIGPIGMHLKLKNGKKYATSVDAAMNTSIYNGFIVQHLDDIKTLAQVFDKYKYGRQDRRGYLTGLHDIYYSEFDRNFDCRRGMPASSNKYCTVLEELMIGDELVKQVLVNTCNIESIILVENRRLGEEVTRPWPRGVAACYDLEGNKIGNRHGGSANIAYTRGNFGGGAQTLCGNDVKEQLHDVDVQMRGIQAELDDLKRQHAEKSRIRDEKLRRRDLAMQELSVLQNKKTSAQRSLEDATQELDALDSSTSESEATAKITSYEEHIRECEAEMANIQTRFVAIREERKKLKEDSDQIHNKVEELNAQMDAINSEYEDTGRNLEAIVEQQAHLMAKLGNETSKLESREGHLDRLRMIAEEHTEACATATAMATEYCDGEDLEAELGTKTTKSLAKEIQQLERVKKEKEGRYVIAHRLLPPNDHW